MDCESLEWKSTINLRIFHSLFEWDNIFVVFVSVSKAHDIFFHVVSGLKIDVYSFWVFFCFFLLCITKRQFCSYELIEIYFLFLSQKLGQEILWHTNLHKPGKRRGSLSLRQPIWSFYMSGKKKKTLKWAKTLAIIQLCCGCCLFLSK